MVFFFTGLCGNARLADVGGPGFLLPLPQKDKVSIQYEAECLIIVFLQTAHLVYL